MSDDAPPAPGRDADPVAGGDDAPVRLRRQTPMLPAGTTTSRTASIGAMPLGDVVEAFEGLEAGVETDTVVSVAGRLMLRRDQGRLAFGTLQDATGRIQLFATAAATPGFEQFTALSIGDCHNPDRRAGAVMATRRGELSVRVDD